MSLSAKDYATDQDVRWCPGCGDYAILKAVQKTLADLNASRENTVFISGIGCAARFPYYMNTYGFHTIHGRAGPVATGIKLARPSLDVWVVSGDGDSLSIGAHHLVHLLRRNVDLQYLLLNNAIYGLTKGQASPTSHRGTPSPSSPTGTTESPLDAALLALGSGARFVARAIDVQARPLMEVLKQARAFQGTGFVEIFQNCLIYNDGVFKNFTHHPERQLHLVEGHPLVFGQNRGLRLSPETLSLESIECTPENALEKGVLVHNPHSLPLAFLLARMQPPLPVALGVLYANPSPPYRKEAGSGGDLHDLLRGQ